MRVLPAALMISAALHGGAIAWVRTHPSKAPESASVVTPTIELVPPEAEPMTVALLDDHSVVSPARVPSQASNTPAVPNISRSTRATLETAAATTTTTLVEPPPVVDPGPGTSRHPMMTMRRPQLDKGPSAAFTARFLANSRALAPKDIAGEQLQDELRAGERNLRNPRWVANATAGELAAERMRVAATRAELGARELKPDGAGTKAEHQTFRVRVAADGTARIEDKANLQRRGLLGGSFDITDGLMRRQGIDPYASYKLKVLDETREERVAIGKRYRTQQLAQSRQHMQRNLSRLWASTTDLAERKQGLFELWDDCAETGSDELIAGGRAARDYVVGFIRSKLPAGSAGAFTAADLARFNRLRKSGTQFAPY